MEGFFVGCGGCARPAAHRRGYGAGDDARRRIHEAGAFFGCRRVLAGAVFSFVCARLGGRLGLEGAPRRRVARHRGASRRHSVPWLRGLLFRGECPGRGKSRPCLGNGARDQLVVGGFRHAGLARVENAFGRGRSRIREKSRRTAGGDLPRHCQRMRLPPSRSASHPIESPGTLASLGTEDGEVAGPDFPACQCAVPARPAWPRAIAPTSMISMFWLTLNAWSQSWRQARSSDAGPKLESVSAKTFDTIRELSLRSG